MKRKLKVLTVLIGVLIAGTAIAAGMKAFDSSSSDLGHFYEFKCDSTMTCSRSGARLTVGASGSFAGGTFTGDVSGDGGDQLYGFLQNQIASSATTLTAAQCGSTIVTAGAHEVNLPEASTVLGCRYTFVGGTADTLTIDPADASDQIGPINFVAGGTGGAIAPAAGDAVSFTDIGASLELEACGANLWCPVGVANLTITDAN